jgi:hypothetical protein
MLFVHNDETNINKYFNPTTFFFKNSQEIFNQVISRFYRFTRRI